MTIFLLGMLFALITAVSGCGAAAISQAPQPDHGQVARCSVKASLDRPLITEWPATERSRFESLAGAKLVVVSQSGCEMRVLETCQARGEYQFSPTTVATDGFSIQTEDELYAKLPLGAVALEGELRKAGTLTLNYVVRGQYQVPVDPAKLELEGDCEQATHVVSGYAVGAFKLTKGTSTGTGGGASLGGLGGGLRHAETEGVLRSGGDVSACEGDDSPGCRTPIQLFLARLRASSPSKAAPQAGGTGEERLADRGPETSPEAPSKLPSTRFLLYLGGGVLGGSTVEASNPHDGEQTAPYAVSVGPSASGSVGLRHRVEQSVDFQGRVGIGSSWLEGTYEQQQVDATMMLLTPCGDLTFRYRPKGSTFFAGAGVGGQIVHIVGNATMAAATGESKQAFTTTTFWGEGLGETGFLVGSRQEWELGLRGGGLTTLTLSHPLVFWGGLAFGRTLD